MGITHETATRNAFADTFVSQVGNNGKLVFETAGDTEVAAISFGTPCATVTATGVVATFSTGSDTTPAGGTIEHASFKTSGDTKIAEATVSTTNSTNNVLISSLTIATSDTVTLTSLTWTAPA